MTFYPVAAAAPAGADLQAEYRRGRAIGVVRLGEERLFFRARRKLYYIPYGDIRRCYRRVLMVPMRMCCGRGSLDVEYLVVESDGGQTAEIQLPGTRAARILLEELKGRAPEAIFACPPKAETPSEEESA